MVVMSATFRLREVLGPQLYRHRKNLNYHASGRKAVAGWRHIDCFTYLCLRRDCGGRASSDVAVRGVYG